MTAPSTPLATLSLDYHSSYYSCLLLSCAAPGRSILLPLATGLLEQARVKKNAPLIGQTISEVDFWRTFSVIVIGAELAGKQSSSPVALSDLVLRAGDLLVFTASKYTCTVISQA